MKIVGKLGHPLSPRDFRELLGVEDVNSKPPSLPPPPPSKTMLLKHRIRKVNAVRTKVDEASKMLQELSLEAEKLEDVLVLSDMHEYLDRKLQSEKASKLYDKMSKFWGFEGKSKVFNTLIKELHNNVLAVEKKAARRKQILAKYYARKNRHGLTP